MPPQKVYPADVLPAQGVTEEDFNIWMEQMNIYLVQNDDYEMFLEGGRYSVWRAAEDYPNRIQTFADPDADAATLAKRRKQLRTFLGHIAKSCHKSDFQTIMRHSTSFDWIIKKLRENYDIQKKGVHFLNIVDIKWDPSDDLTPAAFYNTYRTHIMNNLRKSGEVVEWQSATALTEDEKMTPMLEDMVVFNVLNLIDPRLPEQVREKFGSQMRENKSLRDLKGEIFNAIPKAIQDLDASESSASMMKVGTIDTTPMMKMSSTLAPLM